MEPFQNNFDYFLRIYTEGNITKAAQSLYISQPSLTQYLKRLEASLGHPLFHRESKPMTLTKAGEIYLDYINHSKDLDNKLFVALGKLNNDTVESKLTIGVPIQMQSMVSRILMQNFMEESPHINVSFCEGTSLSLEKMTSSRQIDAAFIHITQPSYNNLDYKVIFKDEIVLICKKADKRSGTIDMPGNISLNELKHERFYVLNKGFIVRETTDNLFRLHAFSPHKVTIISNIGTILDIIATKGGATIVPISFVKDYHKADELAVLHFAEEIQYYNFCLVYPKEILAPPLRLLLNYINQMSEPISEKHEHV